MLTVLDLFSGLGGFSLGLERTGGFKTVAFCEIDPFARRVLAKHWPEVPAYEDVRSLTAVRLHDDGIRQPDAICGGFPCQDISLTSTKGEGITGKRSGLWSEYARIIRELRPQYAVVENVGPLRYAGRGLDRVLGDLAEVGYSAEWHCIPASFVGANHERDRIWIVAYPDDIERRPGEGQVFEGFQDRIETIDRAWWQTPPLVHRVDDGVPCGVDRRKAIGNSVVPLIPELIGRAILAHRDKSLRQISVESHGGTRWAS